MRRHRRRPVGQLLAMGLLSATISACAAPGSNVLPSASAHAASARPTDLAFSPADITFDAAGRLFVSDCGAGTILRVAAGIAPVVVVGGGSSGPGASYGDGGPATAAQLACPFGLTFNAAGDLFVVDHSHGLIRMMNSKSGVITTMAGGGTVVGRTGSATGAALQFPDSIAFDAAGDLYITDRSDRIVRVDPNGMIRTIAGTGDAGFFGDGGPAIQAQLDDPAGIAFDARGDLLVADSNNNRIRRVDRNGIITTVAGSGQSASTGDGGPATQATLGDPESVVLDAAGNIFVGEADGNRVRRIDLRGVITTYAGTGQVGASGDGGPASDATLHAEGSAIGLAIDSHGNLYIADAGNARIRVVSPSGIITTFPVGP